MSLIHRMSLNHSLTYGFHQYFKIITGLYCSSGLLISTSGDKISEEEKQLLHLALTEEVLLSHIKSDQKVHKTAKKNYQQVGKCFHWPQKHSKCHLSGGHKKDHYHSLFSFIKCLHLAFYLAISSRLCCQCKIISFTIFQKAFTLANVHPNFSEHVYVQV